MNALALLVVLAAALPHAEAVYTPVGCNRVIPMLALDRSEVLAGQMRTTDGDCIVWLNLRVHWWPSRVCNTASHESAHLAGRQHPIPRDKSCLSR